MLTYRQLTLEESKNLQEGGFDSISPRFSYVIGAFNDANELIGAAALRGELHLEPFWVREDYRGVREDGVIAKRLFNLMVEKVVEAPALDKMDIFISAVDPVIKKWLERQGFQSVGEMYVG